MKAALAALAIVAGVWLGAQPGQATDDDTQRTTPTPPVPASIDEFARYLEPSTPVDESAPTMAMGGGGTPLRYD